MTAYFASGDSQPTMVEAAEASSREKSGDPGALRRGLSLLTHAAFRRAAELSGRTVEDEMQAEARRLAEAIERLRQELGEDLADGG